jgi:alkaline phosphatase
VATIKDMIAFDDAIAVAAAFYAQYPNDTLVIVTGDHETGGMTVGNARLGYGVNYSVLTNQTCSFQYFQANQWAAYKAANPTNGQTAATMNIGDEADAEMQGLLAANFGLVWSSLNAFEKERLENAYDKALGLGSPNTSQEDSLLYSSYDPMVVTLTHILNEQAGIGWTSYAHTGVPVPVFAHGNGAARFDGFYDNTDIAKKIVAILGYTGTLPVAK